MTTTSNGAILCKGEYGEERLKIMKKLLLALLACMVVSAMMLVTGCGNNEEELEALRQEMEQLQEQHIQELQEREQALEDQLQELQGEMEALLQEVEALEEKLEEPEPPEIVEVEEEDSELLGEWEAISIPHEPFGSMMEEGWEFDEEFFADGTGVSWWLCPDEEEWYVAFEWDWFTENGQLTRTITWIDEELMAQQWGEELAQLLAEGVGESETVPFEITGDILMMGEPGFESLFQRL